MRRTTTTDDWITPRSIINALGPFDLDPCASRTQPWPCAREFYARPQDGLEAPWRGLVYCNPPYGRQAAAWLQRMAEHNNGIALVFARTETQMFFKHVWPHASALLFLRGRLDFHLPCGRLPANRRGKSSGGPSVLIAYGNPARRRLRVANLLAKLSGAFVDLAAARQT